jgi:hypothetical protein
MNVKELVAIIDTIPQKYAQTDNETFEQAHT